MQFNKGDIAHFKEKEQDKIYGKLTIVSHLFYCEELDADSYECFYIPNPQNPIDFEEIIVSADTLIPAKTHRLKEFLAKIALKH
jgi:hypothetical protein